VPRHLLFVMPAHWQVAISGHALGDCAELGRNAPKLQHERHICVMFWSGILIRDIERLLVHIQDVGHRGEYLRDRRREPRVRCEARPARGLVVHVRAHPRESIHRVVEGTRESKTLLSVSDTLDQTFGNFVTVYNVRADEAIDTLVIRMSNRSGPNPMGVDNIVLRR
jgi:hypothetical protein